MNDNDIDLEMWYSYDKETDTFDFFSIPVPVRCSYENNSPFNHTPPGRNTRYLIPDIAVEYLLVHGIIKKLNTKEGREVSITRKQALEIKSIMDL